MASAALDTMKCPKCGVGNALAIASDENGTNYKCLFCEYGFTKPASAKKFEGSDVIPAAIASENTTGEPGVGSVKADGSTLARQLATSHKDAGPGAAATSSGKSKDGDS